MEAIPQPTTPAKRDRSDRDKVTGEVQEGWIKEAEERHAETFKTPDEAWTKYLAYREDCDRRGVVATIGGCSLFMGFCSESGLSTLSQRGKEWAAISKRARDGIITQVVEKMLSARANQVGAIFYLKNKAGYRDKQPDEIAAESDDWVAKIAAFGLAAGRMDAKNDQAVDTKALNSEADLLRFELPDQSEAVND